MKRGGLLSLCLFTMLFLLAASVSADEVAQNLESKVIESFDGDSGRKWIAVGSKFAMEGYPKHALVNTWPESLFRNPKEDKNGLRSLGIQGKFLRKGYNYIEIVPVKEDQSGNVVADPVELPGRVKNLDLWVWGSNFDYYLEAHLRDHNGIVHVLDLGSLRYIGWKKLNVPVPNRIAQSVRYAPKFKGLELTKLVLWTRPNEIISDFYVYFDHMTVFSDMYESSYDGDILTMPDMIQEIWAEAE